MTMKFRKCFIFLLAAVLALNLLPGQVQAVEAVSEQRCGGDAFWRFEDGTLTIYGTGPMYDYRVSENGREVFYDRPWEALEQEILHLVVEEGVTGLGSESFSDLPNLVSVSLPGSLLTIGNFAFSDCWALETVVLPEGLKSIGQQAFQYCGLKSVEIPASVTFLDAEVFKDCRSLTDVLFRSDPDIPSFMTGNCLFRHCTSLEEIRVEEGHLGLRSIDGALYFYWWNDDTLALLDYPTGKKDVQLRIPEKTTTILMLAVESNPYLETVILPDTVQSIGHSAFAWCQALNTVIFEGSVPTVGRASFNNCNLTVYYPCGDEFWTEAQNTWDPESLVGWQGRLAWKVNHSASEETEVIAPTCTEPGYATYNCTRCGDSWGSPTEATGHTWGQWVITKEPTEEDTGEMQRACESCGYSERKALPTREFACGDSVFWQLEDGTLTIFGIGSTYDYYGIVAERPWHEMRNEITSLVVEEGVTEINRMTFYGMKSLTDVSLPDSLTFLGNFAFTYCTALETVNLPEGLTGIGQQAFAWCDALKSVKIPASVTFLDACVFEGCKALTDVLICSDPNIPGFTMGNAVFRNCPSLEEIRVEEGHLFLRSIDGALYFQWEDGTRYLNSYPAGRKNTELQIAENTTGISRFCFDGNPYLKTVIFPATLEYMEHRAFMMSSSLKTLIFEGSAPVVESNTFVDCQVTVIYPCGDETWEEARNTWNTSEVFGNAGSAVWEVSHAASEETEVIAPTCTEPGCTVHTCTNCGYTYTDGHVDATGHSFSEWVVLQEPADGESGLRERTCATCGHTETEVIPWCYGDANGDEKVNGKDLILLRQYLADWDVELDEAAADCNGDGKINGKDLILLRQYLADWDVTLGKTE